MSEVEISKQTELDKWLHDDCRAIYKIVVDDIKGAYDDQWRVANHAVAVFGVLAAACRWLLERRIFESNAAKIFYSLLGTVVLVFASFLISRQLNRLEVARNRLSQLRDLLHPSIQKIVMLPTVPEKMTSSRRAVNIRLGLLSLVWVLFVVVIWL